VEVVKVPQHELTAWRTANKMKCASNPLLPCFSPDMKYACLTKTHFTHAIKLGLEGHRSLRNQGSFPLVYENTQEWNEITANGPLCTIYSEGLWDDKEALQWTMLGDNLNAAVQLGEDEMQAFGRVDSIVQQIVSQAPGQQTIEIHSRTVFEKLKAEGFGVFFGDSDAGLH